MANLLRDASSPYLLQHQDNPVHWRPWGAQALAEARINNKPILLSIGYAACHWCHVMAHESFEDPAVAALMNAHFVSIKVDREERPEIDQLYMGALHAMGEQGGWPLTMFLTPEGTPFWGGTYFPPTPRFGRPSFSQVLNALAKAWANDRDKITETTASMTEALANMAAPRPGAAPGPRELDAVRAWLLRNMDWEHGGTGTAPKFPNAPSFSLLWQEAHRTGDQPAAQAVRLLLDAMSQGGIYDHLGGGYARYATDQNWLIPHFEKMLYDNAQILELLALAYAADQNPLYAARARETVEWMIRDMRVEGAFAASEDADSEGEEGKFYIWTRADIAQILGPDTDLFAAHYPLPEQGNWEEKIILERVTPLADAASEQRLASLRQKLFSARAHRIRPGRDDKILADWNALAIAALARAGTVFAEPAWLILAEQTFEFIITTMADQADGRVAHAYRTKLSAAGLLEDQAAMLRAALVLYEVTAKPAYLARAEILLRATEQNFADGSGAFFMSAHDATDIPGPRARPVTDGPTQSGNGLMAENYARLHHLTGDPRYREKAEAVLAAFGARPELLAASPTLLAAADTLENAACVVITGNAEPLAQSALASSDPATITIQITPDTPLLSTHPAHGKPANIPAAYVCQRQTCAPPVTTAAALHNLLRSPPPR